MTTARAPFLLGMRLLRILWRMAAPLAVGVNLVAWPWLLDASPNLKRQAVVTALFVTGFAFLVALAKEILSPLRAGMRLIPMADHRAQRLTAIMSSLLFILLGTELAIYLVRANGWNPAVASLVSLLRTSGLIVFLAAAINRSGLLRKLRPASTERYRHVAVDVLIRFVFPVGVVTLLFFAVAHELGYREVAHWAARNALWTVLAVIAGFVVFRLVRNRLHATTSFMQDEVVRDERTTETEPPPIYIGLERIFAGAFKIVTFLAVAYATLSIWSVSTSQIDAIADEPIIGAWGPTWGQLLRGAIGVGVVLIVGRFLRTLLIFIVFPKADVEVGARYAILTILRYVVIVVAVLLGLDGLGADTSALTVFAGAAGVGLAFGVKDIFANFFSGLIMLLERPVRVGDLIEVGTSSGKVEAIQLRGTVIRTFDNTTITIPNQQMLGERLSNLSYGMDYARMLVEVGVSYDADPRVVQRVLTDVATSDVRVLDDPKPSVRFNRFGESSLDFVLRCFTAQTDDRWAINNDLRIAVFEALKREGIEIPFPQRDIHITSDVRAEERPPA